MKHAVLVPMFNSASSATSAVPSISGAARGGFDSLDFIDGAPGLVAHARPNVVPRGAPLAAIGWALAPDARVGPDAVVLVVDGSLAYTAESGIARGDIAEREDLDERIGFRCVIPTDLLVPGGHELRAYAVCEGRRYAAAYASFLIVAPVAPSGIVLDRTVQLEIEESSTFGARRARQRAVHGDTRITFTGWAFDPATNRAPAAIGVRSGAREWFAPCVDARPDVAATWGLPDAAVGFQIAVPAEQLGRGEHPFTISAYDAGGSAFRNRLEIVGEIAGRLQRFPLAARERAEPAHAQAVARIDDEDDERPLPPTADILTLARGAVLHVDGWALTAGGVAAADVFLEISHAGHTLPPIRIGALAGKHMRERRRTRLLAPRDDSWFSAEIPTAGMRAGAYRLALLVIEGDRRSLARTPLAGLDIIAFSEA